MGNYKGLVFSTKCSTVISKCEFNSNVGSLYAFNSDVNINGNTSFQNNKEQVSAKNLVTHQQGGSITSFQSTVIFRRHGINSPSNNQTRHEGAILATESIIQIIGETLITKNKASNGSGGGISLRQSIL